MILWICKRVASWELRNLVTQLLLKEKYNIFFKKPLYHVLILRRKVCQHMNFAICN